MADDDEHIARVAGLGRIALVLISYRHGDHTDAIDKLVALTGAPVWSAASGLKTTAWPTTWSRCTGCAAWAGVR